MAEDTEAPEASWQARVSELVNEEEAGHWTTCTGCHESEDGHDVGHYPFSKVLGCKLGGGCRECGGLGAVWDDTDYGAMADELARGLAGADSFVVLHDITAERQRQVDVEGWTPGHDDGHETGEMSRAAAAYAASAALSQDEDNPIIETAAGHLWPWDRAWWKPKGARQDLVRAGALIVAEIERLDRAAARQTQLQNKDA